MFGFKVMLVRISVSLTFVQHFSVVCITHENYLIQGLDAYSKGDKIRLSTTLYERGVEVRSLSHEIQQHI